MNRKITYSFRSLSEVSHFIERPNDWSDFAHFHSKSPIERISFAQGIVESQFFDHFLFQMEAVSARIHQEVKVDYALHQESFILLIVLDGTIAFEDPSSEELVEISAGDCIGVYGKSLESFCQLSPGDCGLCYIIPKNNWSTNNMHLLPTFNEFWREMKRQYMPFDALPTCMINEQMELAIKNIFFQRWYPKDILKAGLTEDISELFFGFHDVVTKKLMQRPYRIRKFMQDNYEDSNLNVKVLTGKFLISESTLMETFKKEFNITPIKYLVKYRIQRAKVLIERYGKAPLEVCYAVGYVNFRSFSIQFKNIFGVPPSKFYNPE